MNPAIPHPIPYQGSKRKLAPIIGQYIPTDIDTFCEPFCGSAAMSIFAARHNMARQFILADSQGSMVELLRLMINTPSSTAARYREIWNGQVDGDHFYFNSVRDRYNEKRDPIDLLYLICRCVKNAIRYNAKGNFTQSVDKRRLGMRPDKMETAIHGVSYLLKGKVEFRIGDWLDTTADARKNDFLYMDPPYLGTSTGRDKRYHQQITSERIVGGLDTLISRSVPFALSYDGMTGNKTYGPPLPSELGLTRLLLHAGISSQATLSGQKAETIESLYMSPGLATPAENVIRAQQSQQQALAL